MQSEGGCLSTHPDTREWVSITHVPDGNILLLKGKSVTYTGAWVFIDDRWEDVREDLAVAWLERYGR